MMPFHPAIIGAAILWVGLGAAAVRGQGHGHHDHGNHHWHGSHHGGHGHGGHYGGGHYGHDHHWHGGHGGYGWGYSYPRYSGFSLSIGSPYSFYGLGVAPYSYGYRSDYFDYRNDYYNRLLDSYRRDIQLNLRYPSSSYLYGSGSALAPSLGLPSYYPPVATIEPLGSSAVIVAKPSGGIVSTQSRLPLPADNLPVDAIPGALRDAAHRLSVSLSRRPNDADIWLGYLAPDRILAALDSGSSPKRLTELLRSYDGVTANPSLDWLVRTDGFEATRRLLRQWIESSASASAQATSPAAATPDRSPSKPIPPQDPPSNESDKPEATDQEDPTASPPPPPTADPVGATPRSARTSL